MNSLVETLIHNAVEVHTNQVVTPEHKNSYNRFESSNEDSTYDLSANSDFFYAFMTFQYIDYSPFMYIRNDSFRNI